MYAYVYVRFQGSKYSYVKQYKLESNWFGHNKTNSKSIVLGIARRGRKIHIENAGDTKKETFDVLQNQ